jgi:hypothetical protein
MHVSPTGRWPHDALVVPSFLQAIAELVGPPMRPDADPEAVASERLDLAW